MKAFGKMRLGNLSGIYYLSQYRLGASIIRFQHEYFPGVILFNFLEAVPGANELINYWY
jgi:hypothetical protein